MVKRNQITKHKVKFLAGVLLTSMLAVHCSKKSSKNDSSSSSTSTNYSVSGNLSSTLVASSKLMMTKNGPVKVFSNKTITHVMAISSDASGEKFVGTIASDGSFTMGIKTGKPYVFVFVDENQVGEDMIVGIFKPDTVTTGLDTLVPKTENGSVSLGSVTVDGTTQAAQMSTSFSEFLTAIGIDSTTATTIGAVDDLSMRNANPDVDANGEIDMLETPSKDLRIDVHVRSNTSCTTGCGQNTMPLDSLNGSYITEVAGFTVSPSLTSVYAVYNTTFDSTPITSIVQSSGVSTTLLTGATFTVSAMANYANPDIDQNSSFSGGTFSSYNSWGADYSLNQSGVELIGYDKPVKLTYTFNSKTLTFPFFKSRPKAGFFTLIPDIKINQTANKITSIDYAWRKWTGSAWAAATADEVSLIAKEDTASVSFYLEKGNGVEKNVMFRIPTASASGNIVWNSTNVTVSDGVTTAVEDMGITSFCSGISYYQDKLGLSIFGTTFAPAVSGGPAVCN